MMYEVVIGTYQKNKKNHPTFRFQSKVFRVIVSVKHTRCSSVQYGIIEV